MKKWLLLCVYVLASVLIGPELKASFRLDRAEGVDVSKGLRLGDTTRVGPFEHHWVAQPPPPLAPVVRVASVRTSPKRLPNLPSSGRCGGDLPPCWVMRRESGPNGDINAYNPGGCSGRGCYGKWQCDPRTCDGTGTEEEQDAEARRVWNNGKGCSHWNAC